MPTTTNPDPATLTGWGLSKAVAEANGYEVMHISETDWPEWSEWYIRLPGENKARTLPAYHEDETACFRDLVPVLAARGYKFCLYMSGVNDEAAPAEAEFYRTIATWHGKFWATGSSPAEAICKAFLVAMQEPTE